MIGKEGGDPLQAIANTEAAVKASPDDFRAVQKLDYLFRDSASFSVSFPCGTTISRAIRTMDRHTWSAPAHRCTTFRVVMRMHEQKQRRPAISVSAKAAYERGR